MSDFFELPPPPPTAAPKARGRIALFQSGPPRGAVPAVAALERTLARTDEVVVSLGCLWVYPAGFEFEVSVDFSEGRTDLDPFESHRRGRSGGRSPDQLRFGFQFVDGSKATSLDPVADRFAAQPPAGPPVIRRLGGHSMDGHWAHSFWVRPLPPAGSLEFVFEWPAAEIPLTRTELDCGEILRASSRAQTLFTDPLEAPL